MAIPSDYAIPVQVNGFSCKNCTDVGYAKKYIDPQHPKSGPFNVNAASDPSRANDAVTFGGAFTGMDSRTPAAPAVNATGALLDIRA